MAKERSDDIAETKQARMFKCMEMISQVLTYTLGKEDSGSGTVTISKKTKMNGSVNVTCTHSVHNMH